MAASINIKTKACCLCRITCLALRNTSNIHILKRCHGTALIPGETDIDPAALEAMENRGVSFKGHPGIMTLKSVSLPERLERAMDTLIEKYPVSNLKKRSDDLVNYLHSRHTPLEDSELKKTARQLYNNIVEKGSVDLSRLDGEEKEKQEKKLEMQVIKKLQFSKYHWRALNYDAKTALTYLHGHMAQNYGILLQCFTEISRREPDYQPRAIYDLGSGLGSSVWAGSRLWGTGVFEFYCVDTSRDMNTLARLLLQDGEEQKRMHIPGVYFRQFSPSPQQNSFSLVVCNHTLLELPSRQDRHDSIAALWRMTEDFLVLIDNGSKAGFSVIDEAKHHILQISEKEGEQMGGHVFAPCPHDSPCPKLDERNSPCMFSVSYKPYVFGKKDSIPKQSSHYSYVILRKGKRTENVTPAYDMLPDKQWPRIIQEVKKRSSHVHCHLCCPNGSLSHEVITKKRNGSNLYKCSRSSRWGDLFPVRLPSSITPSTDTSDSNPDSDGPVDTVETSSQGSEPRDDVPNTLSHDQHHDSVVI